MTDEEKAMVMAIAGPLNAEMTKVENTTYNEQGYKVSNGPSFKDQLTNSLQRDFGGPRRPSEPQYNNMFMPPELGNLDPALFAPYVDPNDALRVVTPNYPAPRPDSPQMEFRFDEKEQVRTNDILEKILKKLTIVVTLLESNQTTEKKSDVVRLKP